MPDHTEIEIAYDSRSIHLSVNSISQSIVVAFCLDDFEQVHADPDYTFKGASDDVVAAQVAYSLLPRTRFFPNYSGVKTLLVLNDMKITQIGGRTWRVEGEYQYEANNGIGGQGLNGGATLPFVRINFSIGGGSRVVTKAPLQIGSTVNRTGFSGPAPNFKNAIGVTKDTIQGTEVPTSDLEVQITGYYNPSYITLAFVNQVKLLVGGGYNMGSYNASPFLGAAAGEVQLRAASGGGSVADIIPITYTFSFKANLLGVEDEGFPTLTALGHDVIDYFLSQELDPSGGFTFMVPYSRTIYRLSTPVNYDLLALPV